MDISADFWLFWWRDHQSTWKPPITPLSLRDSVSVYLSCYLCSKATTPYVQLIPTSMFARHTVRPPDKNPTELYITQSSHAG